MTQPLVSVVMPTYNHAQFLKEAIASVLAQTHSNIELIVVDNFSSDNTEEIVQSFGDSRIKYFKFSNNGIIAASRNYGIKQANGAIFAFIDSDDVWFEDKLTLQLESLKKDPQNGLACCYFKVQSDDQRDQNKVLGPENRNVNGFIYERLLNSNFIVSSSTMLTREAIEKAGTFDENIELMTAEDFDLWLRIAREFKVVFIPEVLGVYRMHQSNASAQDSRLHRAIAVIDKHLASKWITKKQSDFAKANFSLHVGWTLVEAQGKLARKYLQDAMRYDRFSIKIFLLCSIALVFTFIPGVFKFIRKKRIDRKIASKVLNT